jgi:hypothetical protein
MYVHLWSPDANIPIRLKIEDSNDPTRSVETQILNTTANAWEVLEFDFTNQATGTAALNTSYTFDKASIFFNFGFEGSAPEKTYYFDNVSFGAPIPLALDSFINSEIKVFPNPSQNVWFLKSLNKINAVKVYDVLGKKVFELIPQSRDVFLNGSTWTKGIYFVKIDAINGAEQTLKLVKK